MTDSGGKAAAKDAGLAEIVRRDFLACLLVAAEPPSARAWWKGHRLIDARVPGDSTALRRLWRVDNWVTGVPMFAISVVFLLLGGGVRWIACSPARRWLFFILAGIATAWWLLA